MLGIILITTAFCYAHGQGGCSASFRMLRIQATAGQRSIELSWNYNQKGDETGFRLKWNREGSEKTVVLLKPSSRKFVINDLDPYTLYETRIQVMFGANCTSIDMYHSKRTKDDYPGLPRNITVEFLNNTAINVTWLPPAFPNGPELHYILFWKRADRREVYKNATVFRESHKGIATLFPNGSYVIQMMAVNSFGDGNRTSPLYFSAPTNPSVPNSTLPNPSATPTSKIPALLNVTRSPILPNATSTSLSPAHSTSSDPSPTRIAAPTSMIPELLNVTTRSPILPNATSTSLILTHSTSSDPSSTKKAPATMNPVTSHPTPMEKIPSQSSSPSSPSNVTPEKHESGFNTGIIVGVAVAVVVFVIILLIGFCILEKHNRQSGKMEVETNVELMDETPGDEDGPQV